MKKGEVTAASLWVANDQNDKGADGNYIQAGWAVSQEYDIFVEQAMHLHVNSYMPFSLG